MRALLSSTIVVSLGTLLACSGTGMTGSDGGGDGIGVDGSTDGTSPSDALPGDAPADGATCTDMDRDGVTTCAGDCNDGDPLVAPGLPELCGDMVDNNCNGMADEGCTRGLGTYVSAITGNDMNPGTRAMPVRTIRQGVVHAMMLGVPQSVIVAQGDYSEKVTMVAGVNLLGGFQCAMASCTWASDPAANAANIRNVDLEGVLAPAAITRATRIEGFHIYGRSGAGATPGSSGLTLAGSPTVRRNTIVGGDVTSGGFGADRSMGIRITPNPDPMGALIEGNDLAGGTSINSSVGLTFDWMGAMSATAVATVRGNVLRGGSGQRTAGMTAWISGTGTLVTENEIFPGTSTGGASRGIEFGGRLTIDRNRIGTDPARAGSCTRPTGWCAGIYSESSTSTITNNIVVGPPGPQSAAVFLGEFEVAAGAVILNANTLDGGGSGPGSSPTRSAALVVSIGPCMTCGFRGQVGRVRNNILLGGNNAARFGILEDPAMGRQMRPEVLQNNLIFFAPAGGRTDVMYRQMPTSGTAMDVNMLAALNALTMPMSGANVSGDPLLDAMRHVMAGSPTIDRGTATEAPMTDVDGDARPRGAGIDIGADER